jgi:hypothetical protein
VVAPTFGDVQVAGVFDSREDGLRLARRFRGLAGRRLTNEGLRAPAQQLMAPQGLTSAAAPDQCRYIGFLDAMYHPCQLGPPPRSLSKPDETGAGWPVPATRCRPLPKRVKRIHPEASRAVSRSAAASAPYWSIWSSNHAVLTGQLLPCPGLRRGSVWLALESIAGGVAGSGLEEETEHARVGGPGGQGSDRVAGPASRSSRSRPATAPGWSRLAWPAGSRARPAVLVTRPGPAAATRPEMREFSEAWELEIALADLWQRAIIPGQQMQTSYPIFAACHLIAACCGCHGWVTGSKGGVDAG